MVSALWLSKQAGYTTFEGRGAIVSVGGGAIGIRLSAKRMVVSEVSAALLVDNWPDMNKMKNKRNILIGTDFIINYLRCKVLALV